MLKMKMLFGFLWIGLALLNGFALDAQARCIQVRDLPDFEDHEVVLNKDLSFLVVDENSDSPQRINYTVSKDTRVRLDNVSHERKIRGRKVFHREVKMQFLGCKHPEYRSVAYSMGSGELRGDCQAVMTIMTEGAGGNYGEQCTPFDDAFPEKNVRD